MTVLVALSRGLATPLRASLILKRPFSFRTLQKANASKQDTARLRTEEALASARGSGKDCAGH